MSIRSNRAGYYESHLKGELKYKSFCPAKLPPSPPIDIDEEMRDLLIESHKWLSRLDEKAKHIPDKDLFIAMFVEKEALLSSQIEGTQATLEDIFDPSIDRNQNADVNDVINYTRAMKYALERLETLPLCNRLLLEVHQKLLSGVRGKDKKPGEFRRSQNWIGGYGSTLKTARYIPPSVDCMQEALSDLEKYMHTENQLDVLIRAALIHYQFESIHPFLDGNGRIGRLLIILYLIEKKIISTPSIYISYYLKLNRIEYYDRMSAVRDNGHYEQWIKFFLKAIIVSCEDTHSVAEKLVTLQNENMSRIARTNFSNKKKETLLRVFHYVESYPLIEIGKTAKDLEVSYNTVADAVRQLVDLRILKQYNDKVRGKVFIYHDYIESLRSGT